MNVRNYSQNESKRVWDKFYRNTESNQLIRYVSNEWFSKVFEREFHRINQRRKGHFLEAGCGEGMMSARLSKKGNLITLLDLSEKALEQARINFQESCDTVEFVEGDIFSMPFSDDSFDVVWNQGVIEHFTNDIAAIREMYRVTKRGGVLILFVPARISPLQIYKECLNIMGLHRYWPFEDQIFYSIGRLTDNIKEATGKTPHVRRIPLSFGFSMVGYVRKG